MKKVTVGFEDTIRVKTNSITFSGGLKNHVVRKFHNMDFNFRRVKGYSIAEIKTEYLWSYIKENPSDIYSFSVSAQNSEGIADFYLIESIRREKASGRIINFSDGKTLSLLNGNKLYKKEEDVKEEQAEYALTLLQEKIRVVNETEIDSFCTVLEFEDDVEVIVINNYLVSV